MDDIAYTTFINDVAWECQMAESKYPDWPEDVVHASAILNEEAGKLTRSAIDHAYEFRPNHETLDDMRRYAHRVAAMAFRLASNLNP